MGKRTGNQRHTEFRNLTPEDVDRIANDTNAPAEIRRKAQREQKARKTRNRQRRKKNRGPG